MHEFCVTWDWCLHIQFSEDMCTTLTYTRSMPACSIPIGYVHKICILTFLTYWVKDSLGMLEVSLGSMILLKSARGDDFELAWSFDDVWLTEEGVAYMGIFWWYVVHWGTTFHRGKYYLLFSHKSLRIDFDSTLKGLLQNSIGEIFFLQLSRELLLCLRLTGSPSMILDLLGI